MPHLKLAFRTLFKTPFVTGIAVLSLALGIGANAAIFSLFDQMLLQPLPVAEPEELVNLAAPGPKPGPQSCNQAGDCDVVFSYPMFRDLERSQTVLAGLAAHSASAPTSPSARSRSPARGCWSPAPTSRRSASCRRIGRLLGPADDDAIGAHFVAVLSYNFWETQFGSDPAVLGQTIVVNGQSLEIVGVAPREVRRHDPRHPAAGLRADHHARRHRRLHRLRESAELLDLPLRPAQAGGDDRAGGDGAQRALSPDHHRRRGAAAARA